MYTQKALDLKINNIEIQAKRWFQSSYGNTYHSVNIYSLIDNGYVLLGRVPFQYGYGEHYLHTAGELLKELGLLDIESGYALHNYNLQNELNIVHYVEDVKRKKDL